MDLHLRDKHILITGGSKGIGLACAHAFLHEGARVSLISRDADNLARARERLAGHDASRIHTHAADSEPARYLSFSAARRRENTSRNSRLSSSCAWTGAWCQAAMYGMGTPRTRSRLRSSPR